jgi:hypothetical protein
MMVLSFVSRRRKIVGTETQEFPLLYFLNYARIYDWSVNVASRSPLESMDTGGNTQLTGLDQWFGVLAWKRGALLVSFVWVAMIVMVIDRQWKKATFWAMVGAIFALFGIIHVPEAGFKNFSKPVWEQCVSYPDDCWEFGQQWMFFISYLMLAATYVLIEISRSTGFDSFLLPAIDDDQSEEFNDWFRDAAIIIPSSTRIAHSEAEDVSKKTVDTTVMKVVEEGPGKVVDVDFDDDELVA